MDLRNYERNISLSSEGKVIKLKEGVGVNHKAIQRNYMFKYSEYPSHIVIFVDHFQFVTFDVPFSNNVPDDQLW